MNGATIMTESSSSKEVSPHVLYLIHNDAVADTRVLKYAATSARAGLRTTVLAVSDVGRRRDSWVGGAHIIRVPVASAFTTGGPPRTVGAQVLRAFGTRNKARADRAVLRAQLQLLDHDAIEARRESRGGRQHSAGRLLARSERKALETRLRVSAVRRRMGQGWLRKPPSSATAERLPEYDVGSMPGIRWRRHFPWLRDLEIAFAPVIDDIGADIIHVHDAYLMGTASNAAWRARAKGHDVRLVYDAREYVPGLAIQDPVEVCSTAQHEAEYIHDFDEVLAVSEPIADALYRKFQLPKRPSLSYNVPLRRRDSADHYTVRDAAGLAPDDTILVYSGGLHPSRGNHTIVQAASMVPDLHLVLVSRSRTWAYVRKLEDLAISLGMRDRFHVVDFVAPNEVVEYLSGADVAIHSLVAGPLNHEWALPNKLFEYLYAGLPIVVSDCLCMKEFVELNGVGLAYKSEDAEDLARVLRAIVANKTQFVNAEHRRQLVEGEYSWQRQAERILESYSQILQGRWEVPDGDLEPPDLIEHPYPQLLD